MPQSIPPRVFENPADTVARQYMLNGAFLCTCEIRNLETTPGLFIMAKLSETPPEDLLDGKYIGPGESYVVEAADTSITKTGAKIVTDRIWIWGQAVGTVDVEIEATGRSGQQIERGLDGEEASV